MSLAHRIVGGMLAFAAGILAWHNQGGALGWLGVVALVGAAVTTALSGDLAARTSEATYPRDGVQEGVGR